MMSTQTAEATAHGALRYQLDTGLGELTPAERAHARSGDQVAIAAYLGGSDVFDQAITRWLPPTPTRTSATTRLLLTPSTRGGSPPAATREITGWPGSSVRSRRR